MVKEIEVLTAEEREIVMDAVALVTLLVAGADGKIDARETEWASKLTKIRGYKEKVELKPLYREIGETFEDKLNHYLEKLPEDLTEMQGLISEKLAKLNTILPKIDSWYAQLYYESLLSFAKHVAEASGGILGFMSIDAKEKEIISLPMIDPIEFPE
ncbi:MAG: hypothetical protein DWQ02_27625 [Bacteroidetes bacterium]|nr:MAG: hypothetical protein DWQ02_27625 [Bacteroidota bacterium]